MRATEMNPESCPSPARKSGRLIDTLMREHYDAHMRTTIDLPEDLHRIVSSLAVHTRRSLSLTAVELNSRGLASAAPTATSREAAMVTSAKTGLPVIRLPRVVTPEDVKALEDEA